MGVRRNWNIYVNIYIYICTYRGLVRSRATYRNTDLLVRKFESDRERCMPRVR